ncbi:PREDICTED: rRNA-processing protein UTP23 homolog isoform X2 [Nelumbo nucifera]|uniref:rRNA-processing protein UTP23 homolog isoform X2 n=1 Tax=Nelumbo nucifera TaxID=4432 RepID=A0A1U7Z618_NELNU|nr:PREDICTED: rRNA-processing protein UTP23 homolog isoform X2 [Nelumbo nucifera]
MRVKKQKHHRRSVRFYTACFGFREPFKILCDGTFIHHLLVNKTKSANDALSNILGSPVKLYTTRCILAELKSLGDSYSETLQAARNLFMARCDHERRKSAVGCIEEVVGENNAEHFFIATQDTSIREKFREVPGVPVIFGLRNSLFLEPPSAFQRQFVKSTEEERLHMTEMEYKMIKKKEKNKLEAKVATDSPDAHEGLVDQVVVPETVNLRKVRRKTLGVTDKAKFKRKKAKAPNPLSCKKKKIRDQPSLSSNQDDKDGGKGRRKRNRKRRRSGKSINPNTTDS